MANTLSPAASVAQNASPALETMNTTNPLIGAKKPQHLSNLYIMFYRHGMNANLTKGFFCEGNLLDARKRAEAHCKIMNYKYIFVRPMICNLEEEEEYKLHGSAEGELIP